MTVLLALTGSALGLVATLLQYLATFYVMKGPVGNVTILMLQLGTAAICSYIGLPRGQPYAGSNRL